MGSFPAPSTTGWRFPGQQLDGPAVIEERESTVIIGPGGTLRVDDYGNLLADLPATTRVQQ